MHRFEFDREIDRCAVPALKLHPMVLSAADRQILAAGGADMDFTAPPCVQEAIAARGPCFVSRRGDARGACCGADRLAGAALASRPDAF